MPTRKPVPLPRPVVPPPQFSTAIPTRKPVPPPRPVTEILPISDTQHADRAHSVSLLTEDAARQLRHGPQDYNDVSPFNSPPQSPRRMFYVSEIKLRYDPVLPA
jgi:hypothetical protein